MKKSLNRLLELLAYDRTDINELTDLLKDENALGEEECRRLWWSEYICGMDVARGVIRQKACPKDVLILAVGYDGDPSCPPDADFFKNIFGHGNFVNREWLKKFAGAGRNDIATLVEELCGGEDGSYYLAQKEYLDVLQPYARELAA